MKKMYKTTALAAMFLAIITQLVYTQLTQAPTSLFTLLDKSEILHPAICYMVILPILMFLDKANDSEKATISTRSNENQ